MRRLKVNKKSLLQKGGTPAPQMTMDTDSILQGIREKLQGGVSEVEVFQNLMEQQIPLDEIQTAFTALGYDDTMLSNIMTKIQETTDKSSENIQEGNISGSSLPQAQAGNIGITPGMAFSGALQMPTSGFFGTVSTANTDQVTGYRPAKNFYLPQDLGNYGNVDGALGVLAQGVQNLFSKQDTDGDGLMDGTFRDTRAKRHRQKDRRGSYYDYEVTFDEGDSADNYYASNQDLFKGKLRTKEQAAQDFLNNSKVNFNVNTGQYETVWNPYQDKFLNSADNQLKKRLSKNKDLSGPMLNTIEDGVSISDFQQRLADNPAHAELLAQDLGIIKDDRLPAGVSYGVDKDGSAGSYFGANPYLYETMMLDNVYSGDASKDYQLSDFNLQGTSLRNQNTNPPSNNPPSNNPPSSNVDYSYLDPTLNTMFDFEQTLGGFDETTGKAYGLSNLGANRYTSLNPNNPDYLDPKDPNFRANLRDRVKRDYGSSLQGFDQSLQPAMLDFAYNTGRDPRIYLLDQYMKSQGNPAGLDNRGAYKDAMNNFSWSDANLQKNFNQVYGDNASKISALPVADQIKLMNQGRQFYYNNINMVGGKPNPAAAATWLQRPFYKVGGTVDVGGGSIDMGKIDSRSIDVKNLDSASIQKAQFGFDLKGYLKGEQGFIPDYKGESTTKTVNDAVDKYGDAVGTGLDVMQTGMTAAGMVPVVGNVVDVVNAGVSGARSAYAGFTGDTDGAVKHAENAAINAASAIPGAGIAVGAAGLVKDTAGYTGLMNDKSIASNVGIQTERPLVDTPVASGPTKTVASMGYEIPRYQQAGEFKKTKSDEDLWLEAMHANTTPQPEPTIYDMIKSGDVTGLEGKVNKELGNTMDRGQNRGPADIPEYQHYMEKEKEVFSSDDYQNIITQLNSEYEKGYDEEVDEAKIDELMNQLTAIENKFYNSEIGKIGKKISDFYSKNQDPLRHGTSSGFTAKAISDKIKNLPYVGGLLDFIGADDMGGIAGANLLGLGHEVSAYMDYGQEDGRSFTTQLKESAKDMYNNFKGSLTAIGADSEDEIARKVIQGVSAGDYTSGVVNELPIEQMAGETKKDMKNRIKNYNHPYLQEYIEQFKLNNKGDETAIKDIMSQYGVTPSDTLLMGSSQDIGIARDKAQFDLNQYIASQINPNGGQTTVTYKDRIPFNTGPVDDDGNSYSMDERTFYNDDGGYLHLIKALQKKQDGGANTLYEYYTGMGQDLPTIPQRGDIYNLSGGNDKYTGTAAQNTQLLNFLKETGPITMLDEVEIVGKKDDNNSMPTNDDPQDFSLFKDPVGPLANNDFSGIENESNLITDPGQLTANLVNNQALPGGDGSGDLTDDGTATTQITDFSVISDDDTFVPNPTGTDTDPPVDPEFKDPKVKRKNKLMGTINRVKDSQAVKKFADVSGLAVAGAGVINEMFQNKKAREAEESLPFLTMADKAYGMVEEREGDRGLFDENTGIAQPDNIRAYEAQMGTETFMMPPMKQKENIVDLDYETVARLISAGADIEIL